jgi:pimeloyl-ACP methyl ester carboxylesterase
MRKRLWIAAAALAVVGLGLAVSIEGDVPRERVEQRYVDVSSRFEAVDGLRMHFREWGDPDAPALLLLHGQSDNAYSFDRWGAALGERFYVVAPDLPGHGLTGPDADGRYSWEAMADLVAALAEQLGLERYAVGGNSLGGAVAARLTLDHGESVAGLVLIDAIGFPRTEPVPLALQAYAWPVTGDLMTVMTPPFVVEMSLASSFGDPGRLDRGDALRLHDLMLREGNRAAARQVLQQSLGRVLEDIDRIGVPTLVLWGEKDPWTPAHYAGWFGDRIAGAEVVVMPGVGHQPMVEAGAESAATVGAFIERL